MRAEESSIYGWTINFSNGKRHNLAVSLSNNVINSEESLLEQRKVRASLIFSTFFSYSA